MAGEAQTIYAVRISEVYAGTVRARLHDANQAAIAQADPIFASMPIDGELTPYFLDVPGNEDEARILVPERDLRATRDLLQDYVVASSKVDTRVVVQLGHVFALHPAVRVERMLKLTPGDASLMPFRAAQLLRAGQQRPGPEGPPRRSGGPRPGPATPQAAPRAVVEISFSYPGEAELASTHLRLLNTAARPSPDVPLPPPDVWYDGKGRDRLLVELQDIGCLAAVFAEKTLHPVVEKVHVVDTEGTGSAALPPHQVFTFNDAASADIRRVAATVVGRPVVDVPGYGPPSGPTQPLPPTPRQNNVNGLD